MIKRVYSIVWLQCGNSLILVDWSKVNGQSQQNQRVTVLKREELVEVLNCGHSCDWRVYSVRQL